jgi:hypothetical protein
MPAPLSVLLMRIRISQSQSALQRKVYSPKKSDTTTIPRPSGGESGYGHFPLPTLPGVRSLKNFFTLIFSGLEEKLESRNKRGAARNKRGGMRSSLVR